uniref:Uncharacterized protein n=1 Tax=Arundo donax TaxID=35708 RepID=A0A0A9DS21_ARUDO
MPRSNLILFWVNRKINHGNALCLVLVMESAILICHVLNAAVNLVDLDAVQELRTFNAMDVEG